MWLLTKLKKYWQYVVLAFVLGVAFLALLWSIRQKQRELYKLRNAAETASVKADQLRFEATRSVNLNKVSELASQANEHAHQADLLRTVIKKKEKQLDDDLKQVETLKSWKSLDAYNQRAQPPRS